MPLREPRVHAAAAGAREVAPQPLAGAARGAAVAAPAMPSSLRALEQSSASMRSSSLRGSPHALRALQELVEAAAAGALHVVQRHVASQEVDISASPSVRTRLTALHAAAAGGHQAIVTLLVQAGAQLDVRNAAEETPLHVALRAGHKAVASFLMNAGADIHARNADGWTPLHVAVAHARTAFLEYLLRQRKLIQLDVSATAHNGATALHLAARAGDAAAAALLCDAECPVHARDTEGNSALHVAALWNAADVVGVLLKSAADVTLGNELGQTCLHMAALRDSVSAAELLLAAGASADAMTVDGDTPLHVAVANSSTRVAQRLVEVGRANVDAENDEGLTPLAIAVQRGRLELAKLLVAAHASVDPPRCFPLHVAAQRGSAELVSLLVQSGADVHRVNGSGMTPLTLAALCEQPSAAQALAAAGGDVAQSEQHLRDLDALNGVQVLRSLVGATVDSRPSSSHTRLVLHTTTARALPDAGGGILGAPEAAGTAASITAAPLAFRALVAAVVNPRHAAPLPAAAVDEAMRVHSALINPATCAYHVLQAELLLDPTNRALLGALRRAAERSSNATTTLVVLTAPGTGHEAMMCVNSNPAKDETLVLASDLGRELRRCFGNLMVIVDPWHASYVSGGEHALHPDFGVTLARESDGAFVLMGPSCPPPSAAFNLALSGTTMPSPLMDAVAKALSGGETMGGHGEPEVPTPVAVTAAGLASAVVKRLQSVKLTCALFPSEHDFALTRAALLGK